MVRIYTPQHFRNITQKDILDRLNACDKYTFVEFDVDKGKNVSCDKPKRSYYHQTTFPSGEQLADGKSIVIERSDFDLAAREVGRTTKREFLRDLTSIVGVRPSLLRISTNPRDVLLATYDSLEEKGVLGKEYGEITRTVIRLDCVTQGALALL